MRVSQQYWSRAARDVRPEATHEKPQVDYKGEVSHLKILTSAERSGRF